MGFARDLGAAMTFGMSVSTKHKEAETKYGNLRKQHERRLNAYNEVQAQVQSSLEAMDAHFAAGSRNPAVNRRTDIRRRQQRDLWMAQTSGRR